MKMQIKEFAKTCGVSVRTLHYYDEIGILKPSITDRYTGYRYYDEKSLLRMQEILFYRELDFPLKSINEILSSPDYDKEKALCEQKKLLILKKIRLEKLISAIDGAMKGEDIMKAFDKTEIESFTREVKERWGNTAAYKEFEEKTNSCRTDKWDTIVGGMDKIFADFSVCMKKGTTPDSDEVQSLVKSLQKYITEYYYTCTDEILAGLGRMYVADERFKNNIDKHAEGTAEFVSRGIEIYCGK